MQEALLFRLRAGISYMLAKPCTLPRRAKRTDSSSCGNFS
jgi:hypothetical protein